MTWTATCKKGALKTRVFRTVLSNLPKILYWKGFPGQKRHPEVIKGFSFCNCGRKQGVPTHLSLIKHLSVGLNDAKHVRKNNSNQSRRNPTEDTRSFYSPIKQYKSIVCFILLDSFLICFSIVMITDTKMFQIRLNTLN